MARVDTTIHVNLMRNRRVQPSLEEVITNNDFSSTGIITTVFDQEDLIFPSVDHINDRLRDHGVKVSRIIGFGGIGIVYKGVYTVGNVSYDCAIKILKPRILASSDETYKQETWRRFERESVLWEQLAYWYKGASSDNDLV